MGADKLVRRGQKADKLVRSRDKLLLIIGLNTYIRDKSIHKETRRDKVCPFLVRFVPPNCPKTFYLSAEGQTFERKSTYH